MPKVINLALLGSGIFIREEHLPAIHSTPSLNLVAIYSRSLASATALRDGSLNARSSIDLYSDDSPTSSQLPALLSRQDIHVVIIALPISAQAAYIRLCLEAGKHVLSEKPIASSIAEAHDLLAWYRNDICSEPTSNKPTWAVAENVRFYPSTNHAASIRPSLGKTLTFRCRMQTLVAPDSKYARTAWRKTPTHQGGFLLDGGVHFIAQLRTLLGRDDPLVEIAAFTRQCQSYLPPVDTIEAIGKTKSGAMGTVSISFGTTSKGVEYVVGCDKGNLGLGRGVVKMGEEEVKFEGEGSGVKEEVACWAEGLIAGKEVDKRQRPEEALADLEVIEACLRSGDMFGEKVLLRWQDLTQTESKLRKPAEH